jgi:putative flippase GtrA
VNGSQFPVLGSQRDQERGFFQPVFLRWIKFNAVGAIGIVVQLAALAAFRRRLGLDYLWATGFAVEIAVIHNFLWHERFTWADRPTARPVQSLIRLLKFNASNGAVSMAGNLLLMRLLVGEWAFNYGAANVIAVVACSLFNFILGDWFVFGGVCRSIEDASCGGTADPSLREG